MVGIVFTFPFRISYILGPKIALALEILPHYIDLLMTLKCWLFPINQWPYGCESSLSGTQHFTRGSGCTYKL